MRYDATTMNKAGGGLDVIYGSKVKRFLDTQAGDLIRRYRAGESTVDLSRRYGHCELAITRALKRNGQSLRSRAEFRALGGLKTRLALPNDEIERLYRAGASVFAISKKLGTSREPIWRVLRERGIPLRSASEEMKLRWSQAEGRPSRATSSGSEYRVLTALKRLGVECRHQFWIGENKVDLAFLEPTRLAVEIQCSHHSGPKSSVRPERLEQILDGGFAVLVVWSTDAKRDPVDAAAVGKKVIAFLEALGPNPSPRRQYGVVGSKGQPVSPPSFHPPNGARVEGF